MQQVFLPLHAVIFPVRKQPVFLRRMRIGSRIKPADQLFQLSVSLRRKVVRRRKKCRIILFVLQLDELVQRIAAQQFFFGVIHLPAAGVQADVTEIVAQKKTAEAVNRRDLRVVQKRFLTLQVPVVRFFFKAVRNSSANSPAHFRRGCPRERHDKKPVDIERLFSLADHPDDAFDKDGCFAAARRRRDQNTMISGIQHLCLIFCKMKSHIRLLLPVLFRDLFKNLIVTTARQFPIKAAHILIITERAGASSAFERHRIRLNVSFHDLQSKLQDPSLHRFCHCIKLRFVESSGCRCSGNLLRCLFRQPDRNDRAVRFFRTVQQVND